MLNQLLKIVTLGFCMAFSLPQMANAKFIDFACELYGEEGIASDWWRIDSSQKIAIHQAGSEIVLAPVNAPGGGNRRVVGFQELCGRHGR